jgi:3-hydroxyacyl-CoA dehydrogenase
MASGKIAVVGAGLVGLGWAIVFARGGFEVSVHDAAEGAVDRALATIGDRLADLRRAGLIDDPAVIAARIAPAADLRAALKDAIYVQESVFERVDVKTQVMLDIDAVIEPRTWVGSSSSGLPASLYTAHVACRSRCLVAHPLNPPYLAPVVELVPAPWTAPETLAGVRDLMQAAGQSPVTLTREIEGFVLNRLQGVLLMEAWRLVEAGIASVADIDTTVSQGLGLRWAFMGPFETIDLNAPGGVADYAARLGPLYQSIAASTQTHETWDARLIAQVEAARRQALDMGALPDRCAWRDRAMMEVGKIKAMMARDDAS